MTTSVAHFQQAAQAHLHIAASCNLSAAAIPQAAPRSAAYLSSVAVECSLKSLILKAAKAVDTDQLKSTQPKIHKALFTGKEGHNLGALAQRAQVSRYLGGDAPKGPVWARMCQGDRPYSVRYAMEKVNANDARAELDLAQRLQQNVMNLLGRIQK